MKILRQRLIILLIITTVILPTFLIPASAQEASYGTSATLAVNNPTIFWNDNQYTIAPPVSTVGKIYIDICAVAWLFGYDIAWLSDNGGTFRVSMNGKTADFTIASDWYNLATANGRLFVKDGIVYAPINELASFAGLPITETNGIIHIGDVSNLYDGYYKEIDLSHLDEYVRTTYPIIPHHVVYPYSAYTYQNMLNDAAALERMYPELIKTSSIGKSVENRDLLLIEFGKGPTKIFVCGTHHAREYIATTYLMYAIDQYSYAYHHGSMWGKYNPRTILDNVTFCIVPMVNPDGVNLVQNGIYATSHAAELSQMKIYESPQYGYRAWKGNIRGVDVNWNYDKDWSITKNKNPRGSAGFNGDQPNTEPETIAVSQYVDSHIFEGFFSFHTQGQMFYWADNEARPSNIQIALKADTGFAPYKEKATGIGGSFFDYVYRKYNKPTVTVELCPYVGNYPYPDANFNTVWAPTKNVLLLGAAQILNTISIYGN